MVCVTDDAVGVVGVAPSPDHAPHLHCLTSTASTPWCAVVSASMAAMLEVDQTKLADVVNRYVGETTKNLVRLVDVADAFDSVLLFDEADSLFGRRADGDGSS